MDELIHNEVLSLIHLCKLAELWRWLLKMSERVLYNRSEAKRGGSPVKKNILYNRLVFTPLSTTSIL